MADRGAVRLRAQRRGAGAGSPHQLGFTRAGLRQQRGQRGALRQGEAGGLLARQLPGGRADALQLTAVIQQVEVRLQDLPLAPASLQRPGGAHLPHLPAPGLQALRPGVGRKQPRQLHGDRAAAPPAMPQQLIAHGTGDTARVHAAVGPEVAILATDDGTQEGRGDLLQRHPVQAAHGMADAHRAEHRTVAIQQPGIRWRVRGTHRCEVRRLRRPAIQRGGCCQHQQSQAGEDALHGAASTVTAGMGSSPSISGAYIASTRVGGRLNVPGLSSRSVYSSVQRPLGTNR